MTSIHSFIILTLASAANALQPHGLVIANGQLFSVSQPAVIAATATTPPPVLATVFPSPGASPINVTQQSQIVSSFIPQFTLCELPPLAFFTPAPLLNSTTQSPPYTQYSASTPTGNGSCTTYYKPTVTMICATVLSDLTTTYTVSKCSQDITFSTEYGFQLVTPTALSGVSTITPAPTIQTLTTYYIAPWQDLTSAGPPGDVDYKICSGYETGNERCLLEYYQWKTSLITLSSTTTTSINFTTTIPGPSQLIVETFAANITGTITTFSMSTTMELETSTLSESTIMTPKPTPTITGSTVFQTVTLDYAPTSRLTSTMTLHLTLTTTIGTATITVSRPTALSGVV